MRDSSTVLETPHRFVALDRDGTLIVERFRPLMEPSEVELLPGAIEGLKELNSLGLGLVLITNQSAIRRGTMNQPRLEMVHQHLQQLLSNEGVRLDGIYVCPHTPDDGCECRKPKPGLLQQAGNQLSVDPTSFFVIGDKASDIECGKMAGATTFLVRTGYGTQVAVAGTAKPDYTVDGLPEAARVIQRLLQAETDGDER